MAAVGMWVGTFGYLVLYYGVKLWAGVPVSLAQAAGFGGGAAASTGPAAGPAGSFAGGFDVGGGGAWADNRAPIVAPPPSSTQPRPQKPKP